MFIKTNIQKGFTLLELMIVVAIIGTLAAMAYPMYKNSTLKSQVTVANTEISALRTNIDLCLIDGKTLPADLLKPTDADCDIGATKSSLLQGGAPVATFTATDKGAGTLIGTFGGSAQAILKDTTITWTRDLKGAWTCKTSFTTENTLAPFIPNNCKI